MQFNILEGTKFKKSLARISRSGNDDMQKIETYLIFLRQGVLPAQYKTHQLVGNYEGFYECHIRSDLLLIYQRDDSNGVIILHNIGSHSELFG
jgi:mRNA interferase YafQ